ncbi:unnamed protein product, partial [Amoebophrya sp. A25]
EFDETAASLGALLQSGESLQGGAETGLWNEGHTSNFNRKNEYGDCLNELISVRSKCNALLFQQEGGRRKRRSVRTKG